MWQRSAIGQSILDRLPSCVGNPDASNLDRQAVLCHGLNQYRCESTADEVSHCLKLESAGKQRVHIAATRRLSEHFEHAAMARADALLFGLRDHIAGRADLRAELRGGAGTVLRSST